MFFLLYYNSLILLVSLSLSYGLAVILLALVAQRFLSWFKMHHRFVVLSYCIAFGVLSLNALITFLYVFNILIGEYFQYINIVPHVGSVQTFAPTTDPLFLIYSASSIFSFVATWFATALLLKHYSKKLGKAKFWIIISIPLVYFLSQFLPLPLELLSSYRLDNPITFSIIYTLVFAVSKPVGGILFGVAFWVIARSISHESKVREFLMISAYGFILLYTSNQAIIIVNYPYPPFGLATISFMGLSAFLLLVGIYSSAVSVAHGVELREAIRVFATKESGLLGSIGTAYWESEIQKKVIEFTTKNQEAITEQTGIGTSLEEDDVKQYLKEVLKEVEDLRK